MKIEDMTVKEFDEYWAHKDRPWNSPEIKKRRSELKTEYKIRLEEALETKDKRPLDEIMKGQQPIPLANFIFK